MVNVRQITKTEMKELYKQNCLENIVNLGNALYAHSRAGMGDDPDSYEIVWCNL